MQCIETMVFFRILREKSLHDFNLRERFFMQKTKLVFMALIGLAMIEFSLGQAHNAVAAPTASKTSHAASATKHRSKSRAIAHTSKATPTLDGLAAVYSDRLNGRKTSSGQRFSQKEMTAAHRSLPLGTTVLVTNVSNNKTVTVRITDRGPHGAGRVIDLTSTAAAHLGMKKRGSALVKLEILDGSTGKS